MRSARTWMAFVTAVVLVAVILQLVARERATKTSETAVTQSSEVAAKFPGNEHEVAKHQGRAAAISGTVRDPSGVPIVGARVCAWTLDGSADDGPWCVESDDEGAYRLSSLPAGRHTLHASAPEFLPRQWTGARVRLSAREVREHVDFVLERGGVALRGVVRDISGGVVEGAWIVARPSGFGAGSRSVARSDAEGRFSLWTRRGRVDLGVDAEGYARASRIAAAPGPTFDVLLIPESVIVGRVVAAADGVPIEGVTITATARGSGVEPASARSDATGRFRIARLEPGVYQLEARADEHYGEATELVHLGLVETVEDLVIELHPAVAVRGRVMVAGPEGDRPCGDGRVRLIDRIDSRSIAVAPVVEGEVELRGVISGVYEVAVRCEGAIEQEYADVVVGHASSDLVWRLQSGQSIHGQVIDGDGVPVAGVRVWAWMRAPLEDPTAPTTDGVSAPSSSDGSFSVTGLRPGHYDVAVEYGSAQSAVFVVLERGTDAHAVEVVLPPVGAIAGTVRDDQGEPLADVAIHVGSVGLGPKLAALSDDQGRFSLEQVPPGPQRVVAFDHGAVLPGPGDDDSGVLAPVVPGETTQVEIVVRRRDASIRGRVLDGDGGSVPDAFIRHQLMTASGWSSTDGAVLTDADGRFELDGLIVGTPYRVGGFRRGGGEAVVEGVAGGDFLVLTLTEGAEIAGQVLAPDGTLPDRFRVTVHRPSTSFMRSDEPFRSQGRFRLRELPPGDYVILVESPVGVARVESVQLDAGEAVRDLVIALIPRVTVRGRVVDQRTHQPVTGVTITIGLQGTGLRFDSSTADELARTSGADGRFEVTHAPTGRVRISLEPRSLDSGYDWQWLDLDVPATGEVIEIGDLELAPAPRP